MATKLLKGKNENSPIGNFEFTRIGYYLPKEGQTVALRCGIGKRAARSKGMRHRSTQRGDQAYRLVTLGNLRPLESQIKTA
jgi:hypothetical protein